MAKLHIKEKYGVTPNEVLNNPQLSLKAKGLYGFMQSKPENWKFSAERITLQNKDGLKAVRAGIKELEDHQLLKRHAVKKEKGKFSGYDYILSPPPSPSACFRQTDKGFADNALADNALAQKGITLSKKESSKKDIVRKKNSKVKNLAGSKKTEGEKIGTAKLIVEMLDSFILVNPACKKMYGNTTQRDACEFLLDEYGYAVVLQVITLLPKTNLIKYIPTITTPVQLRDKWVQLEAGLIKLKKSGKENNVYKNKDNNIASKITKQLNEIH